MSKTDKIMMKFGMGADDSKKPSLFEQIKLRRRSTNPVCWSCRTYPNCGMCQNRKYLRGTMRTPMDQNQLMTLRSCIKYANEEGNFTPTRASVHPHDLVFFQNRDMIILVKDNRANPYQSIYHVSANHPEVKMYWNQMRKPIRK